MSGIIQELMQKKLWEAAEKGDSRTIRLLVVEGVDLDARDPQGRTAQHIALQNKQLTAHRTLLAAKEMQFLASIGDLPDTPFFRKFEPKRKTGSE